MIQRLINSISAGRFAWEKYLCGGTWNGMKIETQPLFCSYGQIGYTVIAGGRHIIKHDWELDETIEIE